ncbi:MAG: hypothetical protein HY064_11850 [Bacteroidetes bacterium]|nr:hypothetical protein [Bacteroidota bacterium]
MKTPEKKIAEIDCDEAALRFNDFIDNYIKGKAREELLHHIEGCRHCFDRVEFERIMKSKLLSFGKAKPEKNKTAKAAIEKILSKIRK